MMPTVCVRRVSACAGREIILCLSPAPAMPSSPPSPIPLQSVRRPPPPQASGSFDETLVFWDVRSGVPIRIIPGHADPVTGVHFSSRTQGGDPFNEVVCSASLDGIT